MKNFDLDDVGTAQISIAVLAIAYVVFAVLKDVNPETVIFGAITAESALAGMKLGKGKKGEGE
ncbi:MAG: hypothetical protein ACXAB9_15185 [Candidatus Thorarchaeota archaeon]|jgi:hypothetical protein